MVIPAFHVLKTHKLMYKSWSALSGAFIIGVSAGGPPVILYGWIGTCILTLAVACAMAEMCSRWPVAGGQYSWVALMAPKKIAREMSYVTGWFMLMGESIYLCPMLSCG